MIATRDFLGLRIHVELTATEREDLARVFYNLKNAEDVHAGMDANQIARVNNLFSPLYDVLEAPGQ